VADSSSRPEWAAVGVAERIPQADARDVDARVRLPLRTALAYSSGNFGAGMFYAFNNFILSLYLKDLGAAAVVIGLLSSTRSFEGAIIQPVVGERSDRTWNHLGRRRPFILAFIPISVLFMVWTAFAHLGRGFGAIFGLAADTFMLALVAAGVFLFSLSFNIAADPYQALLADITPRQQRGRVNGIFQTAGAVGQVALLACSVAVFQLTGHAQRLQAYFILFLVTAGALALFFVPTVVGVREPRELVDAPVRRRYTVREYWRALRGERQVQLYFATQFFLWFGTNAVTPFLAPYAVKVIGLDVSGALLLSLTLLGGTALFNLPFGFLADRLGLKRVFLMGIALMATASAAAIWTTRPILLFGVLIVASIGNAAQTTSSYPVFTRIVRPDRIGLYTGLNSAITSVAAPAAAAIAGMLIDAFGYAAMFPFVATMFALALVPLTALNVKAGEAKVQAELHEGSHAHA
jgi:maltose/moltooligosaccharide transporter